MSYFSRKNRGLPERPFGRAGFTLVELLVSISIVAVILTVVVLNRSTYTDSVALANLADEIGLTMSQAQAYGIGVRELSPGSSDFSASYGLTFSLLDSGSNSAYLSFADRNGNQFYDGDWACPKGGASECLDRVNLSRGNLIDSLCVIRVADTDLCNLGRVDISFIRPSTEAHILFFDNNGGPLTLSDSIGARVVLKSPGGLTRSVAVYETGQISVESSYTYAAPSPPTVTISASPNPISYNSASTLSWSSTDATGCTASSDWSGSKPTSGSQSTGNLTSDKTYILACSGPEGSDSDTVAVTVGAAPQTIATGGAVTYSGGYTIHTFVSSGTFNVTSVRPGATVEVLIVGGGGGSHVGGGGAGGVIINNSVSISVQSYPVVVGAGGNICSNGSNSSAISLVAAGGGGNCGAAGFAGGSGGGGYPGYSGGSGTVGQGQSGGAGIAGGGGGGGGAGSVGSNGLSTIGGSGGGGVSSSISGSAVFYGGGGGGGGESGGGGGGAGGGGDGNELSGNPGTSNTGGGAGGGWFVNGNVGGSGIVIIRYIP